MRMHAIMLKTLKDLFSIRRSILFLIGVMILPFFATTIFVSSESGNSIANMTLAMQNQMAVGFFIILGFMWIIGIPVVLMAGVTCGDFISKEDQDGTLLLLVSKPVRRYEIVMGKFLAFMINAVLLSLIVLLLSAVVMSSVMETDIYVFNNMMSLVPSMFLYAVFVSFIFGALATALSSLFRSRIKTIMLLVGVTMLIFFGFMMVRGYLESMNVYEEYGFSHMDVNYHLGNSYLFFIQSSGFRMMPVYQGIMGQFTGTYDAADLNKLYDSDVGAMPPELQPKEYNTPLASMMIWTGIALALLLLGILKFERKEVS